MSPVALKYREKLKNDRALPISGANSNKIHKLAGSDKKYFCSWFVVLLNLTRLAYFPQIIQWKSFLENSSLFVVFSLRRFSSIGGRKKVQWFWKSWKLSSFCRVSIYLTQTCLQGKSSSLFRLYTYCFFPIENFIQCHLKLSLFTFFPPKFLNIHTQIGKIAPKLSQSHPLSFDSQNGLLFDWRVFQ